MTKVTGRTDRFSLINTKGNRTIVGYEREAVDEVNSTWHEVSFSKDHSEKPSMEQIKAAVIADIDAQTDARIQSGLVWTPKAGGNPIPVWLSKENQMNFKAAYDLAVQKQGATLPVTFKMGETEEGTPVYHTFGTMEEAEDFYTTAVDYIHQCLTDGWRKKDTFDFTPYEKALEDNTEE